MKRENKNNYKIVVKYSEKTNVPTFKDILESDEFKEIIKKLLIKYGDRGEGRMTTEKVYDKILDLGYCKVKVFFDKLDETEEMAKERDKRILLTINRGENGEKESKNHS